jgi:hypothetical protein
MMEHNNLPVHVQVRCSVFIGDNDEIRRASPNVGVTSSGRQREIQAVTIQSVMMEFLDHDAGCQ